MKSRLKTQRNQRIVSNTLRQYSIPNRHKLQRKQIDPDLDVAVINHCGRLIANVVIAYNSMLLSGLLGRYLTTGNEKALDLLRRISPAAWQHLHFLGLYAFRDKRKPIDLEAILAGIDWE